MAGAGYKLFNTGDVLTAAQVNTYLQEQTVMVFADAAARTTALSGVVAEGMLSYLKDTDVIQYYNGSSWTTVNTDQTPLTTKGDLFTYSTADARLAVGNNGETLVADSSATTGLRWQGTYAAGKNVIINGGFDFWQRGTSFTVAASAVTYTADRFLANRNGSGTVTVSQQTFTPGTAPVAGYEGQYFFRFNQSVAGSSATYSNFSTRVEDVRTLAGQTATLSFWAKTDSARSINVGVGQNFGSGGSAGVYPSTSSVSLTTSWQRFTITVSVPSVSGKTIGTGSYVDVYWEMPLNATSTIDIWGIQLEAGSVATAFTRAGGTLAGEYAAACRYYWRNNASQVYSTLNQGAPARSTTQYDAAFQFPVAMRVAPTAIEYGNIAVTQYAGTTSYAITAASLASNSQSPNVGVALFTIGTANLTAGTNYVTFANNNAGAYVAFSAEL